MTLQLPDHRTRIETARFGPFEFQLGIDAQAIDTLYWRVSDAQQRFQNSPLAQVANELEKEVVVSSIFGTNSIEGGTLNEEETEQALQLDPSEVEQVEQRRAVNLKAAYDLAREAAASDNWLPDLTFIQSIHAAITRDLPHDYNCPGMLRNNPKAIVTHVGDSKHGGRYKPPQYEGDIQILLEALLQWHADLVEQEIPALIRAPLLHYYYEMIHPFWDGNGRVGRVLEATILMHDGFQYAPFAQARYYLDHIDPYFALFNHCRKAATKHRPTPLTDFMVFFLEGMLSSLNGLHDRVNVMVMLVLFDNDLKRSHDEKIINARQYTIVTNILASGRPMPLKALQLAPWYRSLYSRLTDKTRRRDLRALRDRGLLKLDEQDRLWPGCVTTTPAHP